MRQEERQLERMYRDDEEAALLQRARARMDARTAAQRESRQAPGPTQRFDNAVGMTLATMGAPRSVAQNAGPAMRDVGQAVGSGELPAQAIGGAIDALNETMRLIDETGDFLSDEFMGGFNPRVTYQNAETGDFELGVAWTNEQAEEYRRRAEAAGRVEDGDALGRLPTLPTVREGDTTTGQLARGVSQFVTGFAGAGKIIRPMRSLGAAGQYGRAFLRGALADFAVFDPQEDRLSDLIESVPALRNPVTGFLENDGDDTRFEGRIKNVLEGGGIGVAADVFVSGLRTMRSARRARERLAQSMADESTVESSIGRAADEDMQALLGDPELPSFGRMADLPEPPQRQVLSEAEMQGAGTSADEVTPDFQSKLSRAADDVAAADVGQPEIDGLVRSANRWREVVEREQPELARTLGDLEADSLARAEPEAVNAMMDMIDELRRVHSRSTPAAERDGVRLSQFVRNEGGVVDIGGDVSNMAGGARRLPGLINTKSGVSLDDMTLRAWEAGYFPGRQERPDINEFLDLLGRDLDASDFRAVPEGDLDTAMRREELVGFENELERMGIDWTVQSRKGREQQIREALGAQEGQPRTQADLDAEFAQQEAAYAARIANLERVNLGGEEVYFNPMRIDTTDDVRAAMGQMLDAVSPAIERARRGHRSHNVTRQTAGQLDAFQILSSRRVGEPLNAEQTVAARTLWASSGKRLLQAARIASERPTPGNLYAFRKLMALHHAIQQEVVAARSETARALDAWRIPAGDTVSRLREIERMVEFSGGPDATASLARKMSAMDPEAHMGLVDKMVERGAMARAGDALAETFQNILLTNPKTHVVNAVSNTAVTMWEVGLRAISERAGQILGDSAVEIGEAERMFVGMVNSIPDGLRAARRYALEGQSDFGGAKVDEQFPRRTSAASLGIAGDTLVARTIDAASAVLTLPSRALGSADEFFKAVNRRGELYALAHRDVHQRVRDGDLSLDQAADEVQRMVDSPTAEMEQLARRAAEERTFTLRAEPGGPTSALLAWRRSAAERGFPVLHYVLPFINTPANLMSYTFQHTPLAALSTRWMADIRAGGARRQMAITRVATGTTLVSLMMNYGVEGQITGGGPLDPELNSAWREAGHEPYSIRSGDTWISYRRFEPVGNLVALGADLADIFVNTDWEDLSGVEEGDEAFAAVVAAVANQLMSKTYMTGIVDFFDAMGNRQADADYFIQRLASSQVPAGIGEIRRQEDPYMRAAANWLEAMKNRIPGMSRDLPIRRDLWGRPMTYSSGLGVIYDSLSPFQARKVDAEPIDREVFDLGLQLQQPSRSITIGGETISLRNRLDLYYRMVELTGDGVERNGLTLRQYLNGVVSGEHPHSARYQRLSGGPEGGRAEFIRRALTEYREAAKRTLIREHPELVSEARTMMFERRQAEASERMSALR